MRCSCLQGFPVLHQSLDSQCIFCSGKTFGFCFSSFHNRNRHDIFCHVGIYVQHLFCLGNCFFFCCVSGVSFLPQKFSSTQKQPCTHFLTNNICPLINQYR